MAEPEPKTSKTSGVDAVLAALQSGCAEQMAVIASQAHPGDVEIALDRLDDATRASVVAEMPAELVTEWADYLSPADLEHRLGTLNRGEQRELLDSLSDDELVDLLQEIEEEDRPQYIELLDEDKRQVSADLLRYPEHSAGGRMTTAMAAITGQLSVKQALAELNEIRDEAELLSRIYVVDEERRILGKIRLRDLAFGKRDVPVSELMDSDQVSILATADQEEAAQMIARYDLLALPVVDEDGRLLGVITHDDALEILEEESTEDMERISGIGGGPSERAYLQTSVWSHFQRRFAWVLGLAFVGLTSGWVLHSFESVMKSFYILSFYLPMVVAAGGNTGGQAAAVVLRAMSLGELDTAEFFRVIWKEGRIGVLLGLLLAGAVAMQIHFLMPPSFVAGISTTHLATTVGLALVAQVLTSTIVGAGLPLGAKMVRLDPAVVASPAITTLVDISGAVIYFTMAQHIMA